MRITRRDVLEQAIQIVCHDRQDQYGDIEDNFSIIAYMWETYLKAACIPRGAEACVKSKDVAAMMVLLKVARVATGAEKLDNWVDIAGYAACGGECSCKE